MTTTFQSALTSGDYDKLRGTNANGGNRWAARQFITLCKNTVVFAARVVSAPPRTNSVASFGFNSVSVGAYTDVEVGETVFVSHTNNIRDAFWRGRIRKAPIAGTVYINETSINLLANDYFWVVYDFDIWDRLSLMVGNTQYIDYDIPFEPLPPVVCGLQNAYVAWNPDDSAYRVAFDVSSSYPADIYSTSSLSYQFTFVAGTYTVVSGALNTSAVTIDFDANTEQWGQLVVTDSQGTIKTRRFYIRVHGSTDEPALDFTGAQITGSIENGWNATVSAWSGVSDVLSQTYTVIWSQEYYNGTLGPLSIANNIDMIGRFHNEELHGAGDPLYGYVADVRFEVEGIASQMARTEMQDLTTINKSTATKWDEISFNTPQRSIVYYLATHSTVLDLCDLTFPDGFALTYHFQFVPNQGGNVLDAVRGIAEQWNANVEFAPDGRIQVVRDTRYLSDKSGVTVVGNFTTADFTAIDSLSVSTTQKTGKVDADGISYNSGVSNPFLSRAPGNAQGYASGTASLSAQILEATSDTNAAQAELNYRSGQKFAIENLTYKQGWRSTHGGYHFLIPSRGQRVTHTLGTSTNVRGLSFDTSDYWQVIEITISHDNATGAREITTTEELEPPVGDSGDTVPQIAGGSQNNEIVLSPIDPFPAIPDDPGNYLPDDPTPPPYPPLVPPKTGDTVIYTDGDLVDTSRSVVARATPVWTGATPSGLGNFEVKAVCFDPITTNPPIGAYALASDGTDSKFYYTADAFASPVVWTEGATFSGVYRHLRAYGTAGTVEAYNPNDGATETVYDFTLSDYGFTSFFLGTHVLGTGWVQSLGSFAGADYEGVGITKSISSATLSSFKAFYQITLGTVDNFLNNNIHYNDPTTTDSANNIAVQRQSDTGSGTFVLSWSGSIGSVTSIQFAGYAGQHVGGDPGGTLTLTKIIIETGGVNALAIASTDYGATVGSPITVGTSPGGAGGYDVERTGGVNYAAAAGQVRLGLSGSYSNAPGGTLSSGNPVTIIIPYRRWPHGATQYGATDPDYLLAGSALISGASVWLVDGAAGTKTDITPAAGAVGVGPNLATTWQTAAVCYILIVVVVGGIFKLYRSLDGGSTWSLSKTCSDPIYLRYKRFGVPVVYLIDGSTLYISTDHGATWKARTLPSSNVGVGMDMYN